METRNLLIITDSLDVGGAQKSTALIANELSDSMNVVIICLEGFSTQKIKENVKIIYLSGNFSTKLMKILSLIICVFKVRSHLMTDNFDTVLSLQFKSNLVNILTTSIGRKSIKTITSERVYPNLHYKSTWLGGVTLRLLKYVHNLAHAVTCNSEDIKKSLIDLGIKSAKIKVINNGYDKNLLRKKSAKSVPVFGSHDKLKVIFVGRFTQQKGCIDYLRVVESLQEDGRHEFLMVGDGPERPFLEKYINEHKLNVTLTGYRSDVVSLLAEADVLIFPSYYEGYPNIVCESLIVGTPVIGYDCLSGTKELIRPENGTLVSVGDVNGLVKHIRAFQKDAYTVSCEHINSEQDLRHLYKNLIEGLHDDC